MSEWILFNGELAKTDSFHLSVSNRSFNYGDGIFESIKSVNGKLLFREDHIERLLTGMKILKMNVPGNLDAFLNEKKISNLLIANHHTLSARIKINIYRESEGWYRPASDTISCLVQSFDWKESAYTSNATGLVAGIFEEILKPVNLLSGFKNCNSLLNVMAGIYAREKNWDDCILLNEQSQVCEATSSNIFIYRSGQWWTPSSDSGCIAGVMRKQLLQLMREKNIQISESRLGKDDLLNAEELIVTNSIQGIRWIASLAGKDFQNIQSGRLVDYLNERVKGH